MGRFAFYLVRNYSYIDPKYIFEMMKTLVQFVLVSALLFSQAILAQEDSSGTAPFKIESRLGLVAETPIMYGIGYEGNLNKHFSVALRYGFLTRPSINILLWNMEQRGTDSTAIDVLREAIDYGQVASLGINGIYKGFYAGIYGQYIYLKGEETIGNLAENALGIDLNALILAAGNPLLLAFFNPNSNLIIKSALWQLGGRLGKRFTLNEKWDLHLEIAYSMNVASSSTLETESAIIESFTDQVSEFLDDTYGEDANILGLNLGLMYKF